MEKEKVFNIINKTTGHHLELLDHLERKVLNNFNYKNVQGVVIDEYGTPLIVNGDGTLLTFPEEHYEVRINDVKLADVESKLKSLETLTKEVTTIAIESFERDRLLGEIEADVMAYKKALDEGILILSSFNKGDKVWVIDGGEIINGIVKGFSHIETQMSLIAIDGDLDNAEWFEDRYIHRTEVDAIDALSSKIN